MALAKSQGLDPGLSRKSEAAALAQLKKVRAPLSRARKMGEGKAEKVALVGLGGPGGFPGRWN